MSAGIQIAVAAAAQLGEGPRWDPAAQVLLWVDILRAHIHTYDPRTGATTTVQAPQHVGAVAPRAQGGLVVNLRDGISSYAAGCFEWIHHNPVPGRRGNDAAVAPDGALWAGTMRYDEQPGGGTLARLTGDGVLTPWPISVTISNGIGWSPDGHRMYYIDSPTRRIDVFDVVDGLPRGRAPWVCIEPGAGWPDGLSVDADGAVWVALYDGAAVRRYTPDGRLDRTVRVPVSRPTACAFGGRSLTDLYITTAQSEQRSQPAAGSLLVMPGAGHGLAQPPFAG
ncbi:SMP-30/gluconolactonase/LRE family protein [Nocardia salmonicida]|uniref:SMP-30/gluconolactonase/LRE family protein n=1 Tax=Nocardia salmonicida TaxID=53431 RepID=UPI00366B282D